MCRTVGAAERVRRTERGTTALEFALVLPILVMMCFGIISGGIVYYQKIAVANAVREGARFAATLDSTTPSWSSMVKGWTSSASGGELTDAQICVLPPTGGSCPSGPSTAPPVPTGTCLVRVRAEKTLPTGFSIGIHSWPVTVRQDSYARYERPC